MHLHRHMVGMCVHGHQHPLVRVIFLPMLVSASCTMRYTVSCVALGNSTVSGLVSASIPACANSRVNLGRGREPQVRQEEGRQVLDDAPAGAMPLLN